MRRHVIYGRYGKTDMANISVKTDEIGTELSLLNPSNTMGHGIASALKDLSNMGVYPTSTATDLIILAVHVHAADTRVSRDTQSQDTWTRELRIVVPVSNAELWTKATSPLTRALNFLTGDLWTIDFRQLPKDIPSFTQPPLLRETVSFDTVSLFSGGLDSLIGAIDMLEHGMTPLLVSHAGDGETSKAQVNCHQTLKTQYPNNKFNRLRLWLDMAGVKVKDSEYEKSTRGRSFLFFATGIFAGSGLNKPFTLNVPENGLIALNVPLDPLRLGSHSTRTTHPFYIARWNEFLEIIGIPGKIINPYWDKTKGEMTAECANKKLLEKIVPDSMSCAHPTEATRHHLPPQHCGTCLPCIIRRAALAKGFNKETDKTTYMLDNLKSHPLDSTKAEGQQIRSFQYAIHRLKAHPQLATTLIHLNGSLSDESLEQQSALADVYSRGLSEVDQILKGVRTEAK